MDSSLIIEKSVIVVVFATMLMAMYSTLAERKVAAWLQDRSGPNRAGKGGLLQPLADGLKLFSKEEFEYTQPILILRWTSNSNEYCTHDKRCNSLGDRFIFWKRHYTASKQISM
jgi:hypothetical protein